MNNIERYVYNLYKSIQVTHPEQLKLKSIASELGVSVLYGSISFSFNNVVILEKTNKQMEWQMFGHELCHVLRHVGNQLNMHYLFVQLQEWQADYFAYHFCVPTFMLFNLKEVSVNVIANKFNVEYDFALRRFEMYQNKLLIGGMAHGAYSGTRKKQKV